MDVLKIQYTSTTMILIRHDKNRKTFPPQTFETLYDYSFNEEWEFGNEMIDLTVLHLNPNDDEDKQSENKLVKISKNTDAITQELFKIKLAYSDDQIIYLPGENYVWKLTGDGGTHTKIKVKDLKAEDNILVKMFGNVTHTLAVLEVSSIGEYELNDTYHLELDENDIISIGLPDLQIYTQAD